MEIQILLAESVKARRLHPAFETQPTNRRQILESMGLSVVDGQPIFILQDRCIMEMFVEPLNNVISGRVF
jgi:hypothetical protein